MVYNSFKGKIDGTINWIGDSVKCMLVTSAYVADEDLHTVVSDVTNEVVGTGYTAGGLALTTKAINIDNSLNQAKYDADDAQWLNSTITARGAVVYKDTGVAGTSPLICYIDFGGDKVSSSGTFSIIWNADGIFKLS